MTANDTDQLPTETAPTTADSFALLGNEIRMEVIRVLGDALFDDNQLLSYSNVRSQIEVEVDPGQLNYHLKELLGQFIKHVDEGYTLRLEGVHIYNILRGGGFGGQTDPVTVDAGFDCHYCSTPVTAEFSGGQARIECPGCEYRYLSYLIDNVVSILGTFQDEERMFAQLSKYIHHEILGCARGICRTCGFRMDTELIHPSEADTLHTKNKKVYANHLCTNCGTHYDLFVGVALLVDHELACFCYDHGTDVLSTPFWELEFAATDEYVTVLSTDPWEIVLEVRYGGDVLELVVDGDLNVVERNRLSGQPEEGTSLLGSIRANAVNLETSEYEDVVPVNDEACLEVIRRHRWPNQVTCPNCGSEQTIKKGTTGKEAQRYLCHDCDGFFNDLTGTIFAGHGFSIREMFYIVQEMDERKTAQIAGDLDRSYKAVLEFTQEVRNRIESGSDFQ